MLESLEDSLHSLIRLRDNLKKSINHKFKSETLKLKLEYARNLFKIIKEDLSKSTDISKGEFEFVFKAASDATNEITLIINAKLKENTKIMAIPTNQAAAPFDIKTATALVQPYDGSPEKLDSFLDSVSLLAELTSEAHMGVAVKFVTTRLSGKARSILPANITTLNEIVNVVKQNCESLETPESVAAKLKALKSKGDSDKYLESVEMLTAKLTSLYIKNDIPMTVATKMATKTGVDTLINNSTNSDTRIILKAADFPSIQAAIQKFNESNFNATTAQILNTQSSANTSYSRNRNIRGNFTNRGGNRNINFRFNRNQNSYHPRQFSSRNFTNSRGNYQNQNHYQNQNRGQYHHRNNQGNNRVFYTQTHQDQNSQIPPNMMQQQSGNQPMMQHANIIPHLQPHPLGGTQGQYTP